MSLLGIFLYISKAVSHSSLGLPHRSQAIISRASGSPLAKCMNLVACLT